MFKTRLQGVHFLAWIVVTHSQTDGQAAFVFWEHRRHNGSIERCNSAAVRYDATAEFQGLGYVTMIVQRPISFSVIAAFIT